MDVLWFGFVSEGLGMRAGPAVSGTERGRGATGDRERGGSGIGRWGQAGSGVGGLRLARWWAALGAGWVGWPGWRLGLYLFFN